METDIKNVACYRLGTRDTKGERGYDNIDFSKHLRGTSACMKVLIMAKNLCGLLKSNDTYFDDSWFSGVKTSDEEMASRVKYF